MTGFKSGVNRSLVQGWEPNDTAAPAQFQFQSPVRMVDSIATPSSVKA